MRHVVGSVLALLLFSGNAFAANYRWNVDADGNWTDPGNWTLISGTPNGLGYPNAADDIAELHDAITATRTITIPDGVIITLGGLLLDDDNNYVIASGTGLLVFDSGGTPVPLTVSSVNGNGAHTIGVAVQLKQHVELTTTSSGTLTISRAITESVAARNLSVNADGSVVRLAPDVNNGYTGDTLVLSGSLELAGTAGSQAIIAGLNIGGGVQAATVKLIASDQIASSAVVTVGANGVLDLNGQADGIQLTNVTNGAVTIGTGTLSTLGPIILTGASITATGAGQLILGHNVATQASSSISTITGTVNLGGSSRLFTTIAGAAEPDLIINGAMLNGTQFSKSGQGTLRLTGPGDNVFTSAIASDGVLELAKPAGVISMPVNISLGNTFLPDGDATVRVVTSEQIANGATVSMTIDGVFEVNGSGITETIAGLTFVNQGRANIVSGQLIVTNVSMTRGTLTINATGELALAGGITTSASLGPATIAGGGVLNLGAGGTRTFNIGGTTANIDLDIAPIIAGTATLSKTGEGVLRTTAVNTFSGTTAIAGFGWIIADGLLPSPVSLTGGGIGGSGTIGSITGTDGGSSPGAFGLSPGVLRSGPVSFGSNVTYNVQLYGTNVGGYDQLAVTGTVALNGAQLAGHITFTPSSHHRFTIIDNDNADPIVGTFAGLPEGGETVITAIPFRITYVGGDGNDVVLFLEDEDPPTLDPLSDRTIDEDAAQQTVNLTIGDSVTAAADLVVTAQSSNQALVTNAGLTFGGSGSARTLHFTPVANAFGTSTITVRVTDNATNFVERTFLLTVNAVNDAPTITAIANQAISEDGALLPLAFTVDDVDDAVNDVNVTGSSANQALVASAAVTIGGTGANRTIALTPVANASGLVTIVVNASDGEATGQQTFMLTINSVNDAPQIAAIGGPITLAEDTGVPLPIFVNDVDTVIFDVALTASSSNQQIVADTGMIFTGGPSVRTLNVSLVPNAFGTVTITVTASDGEASSQQTFQIIVNNVNDAPTISAIGPQTINEDTSLAPVVFTVIDGDNDVSTLMVTAASSNQALVPHTGLTVVPCPGCGVANAWTIAATPAANAFGTTTITVTVNDGSTDAGTAFLLTVNNVAEPPDPTDPTTPITYVLAEGATGGFFDTDLLIANPNTAAAPITLTFLKQDGTTAVVNRSVAAQSHMTIHVDQLSGLESTSAATTIRSDAGLPLAVERTMFWNESRYGGHTDAAVPGPSTTWVFGEGAQGFFDTYLLIANPNNQAATLTLTFLREGEAPFVTARSVGALSRLTIHADEYPDLRNRSFGISVAATLPVNAERATYFATTPTRLWSGGQASAGVAEPSRNWFLAEGATGPFFDTFILLGNPGADPANVDVQFLLDTGESVGVTRTVPAFGRVTIPVDAEPDPRVQAASLSTVVTSDVPIVAERSMYWPTGEAQPWGEAHHAVGLTGTATRWALAEGRAGGAFNYVTYILLANPSSTAASVNIAFLRENGLPIVRSYNVAPTSRLTINAGEEVAELQGQLFGAAIEVTNGVGIAVERAMYWTSNGIFLAGGTGATATRLP
jgi:hypothetical protein